MIPCAIGAKFQASFLDLFTVPIACGKMCFAECRAMYSAIACRAQPAAVRQLVERGEHSIRIDAQAL
jgi:hypothetical protein